MSIPTYPIEELLPSVEQEHPWLWFVYAAVVLLGVIASALYPGAW